MNKIAVEKRNYHKILINSILNRYTDPTESLRLIAERLEDYTITTHMSLKQTLKKNKQRAKVLTEMPVSKRAKMEVAVIQNSEEDDRDADLDESEDELHM